MDNKDLLKVKKLGIDNLASLFSYYPYRYDIYVKTPLDSNLNEIVTEGIVVTKPIVAFFGKMNKMSLTINIDNNFVTVIIFNRGYMKKNVDIGSKLVIIGKYDSKTNIITASNIKLGTIKDMDMIVPVYHKKQGIKDKTISSLINKYLTVGQVVDYIPKTYADKYNFMDKYNSLKNIHNPKEISLLKKAIIRLKYEELFIFMFKINCLKYNHQKIKGLAKKVDYKTVSSFIANLSYSLTNDQLKAIDDIYNDMKQDKRMNRMIQGDVGCGKTIVALVASLINYLAAYQTAFMVPTEVLAEQHYQELTSLFKNYNINICLLTSSTKNKKEVIAKIKEGFYHIIIGTHSLIQENVIYCNLGLIITDEQHRFGVNQRLLLKNKNKYCDCLYMSATPIPRSYAVILYGDMDLSRIVEKPANRKKIITKVINSKEVTTILNAIYDQLKLNHQIYVIAPAIEESENELETITSLQEKLFTSFKNRYKISILHGKMKSCDKEEVMTKFKNHEVDILIATTVIEVGINVSNATMIVIYDANMFGLSALHQLRGRVGRGDNQSYCLLISNNPNNARLKVLEQENDGFKISEEDYKMRGIGDLFGEKQSGELALPLVDLKKDEKILKQASFDSEVFFKEVMNNLDKYQLYQEIIKTSINKD